MNTEIEWPLDNPKSFQTKSLSGFLAAKCANNILELADSDDKWKWPIIDCRPETIRNQAQKIPWMKNIAENIPVELGK